MGKRKSKDNSDEDFLDAMYEVVGANMRSLPLKNDGKAELLLVNSTIHFELLFTAYC